MQEVSGEVRQAVDHGDEAAGPAATGRSRSGRSRSGKARGAYDTGERSRSAIVKAARALFARHGYRGTSVASVAKTVDLTEQAVFYHFRTKKGLLLAVLADRDKDDLERFESVVAESGAGWLSAMKELVVRNQSLREIVQLFTVLVGEAVEPDHPAHSHFAERYRRMRERMLAQLAESVAAGDVRPDVDLDQLPSIVMAVMDGLQVQWLLDPDVDMAATFATFADLLAVSPRPPVTVSPDPSETATSSAAGERRGG